MPGNLPCAREIHPWEVITDSKVTFKNGKINELKIKIRAQGRFRNRTAL